MAKIKKKEVEQTLSPCESIDRYLANENATHHSSTQNFEMQAKRDLLEFLYVNDSKQREYLSKRVKMPPRSFRRNMKILEEKGTLERKKGSGRPLQISGNEKKRLCQIVILPAVRKNLMGSIPTRLGQCLENEGKFVEKWTGTE